jgi:HK97 family phage major capsid protein
VDPIKLREQVRAKILAKITERKTHTDKLAAMRAAVDSGDATVTGDQVREVISQRDALDAEIDALQARDVELTTEIDREAAIDRLQGEVAPAAQRLGAGKPAYDQVARVGQDKRTYSPDNAREGVSFLADVVARLGGDLDAAQRLQRHMGEERIERAHLIQRDVGTGAFAGLTVPQYLTDLVAPAVAAGRPLADNARQLPLPDTGMTVNISRVTTATAAAVQATENAAVQETDIDDTLLTINVRTIAGQQDMSRQSIERSVGSEQVVIEDLARRYHTTLDSQIINNDGTLGTHLGIRSTTSIVAVTYTDATPTPSEAWGPLWDLQQQIESGVFMAATHLAMHPRRWAFFCSAIGTNQAMLGQMGVAPLMLGAESAKQYGAGVRGILAGLPVIVDANIPTNISSTQDVILGVTNTELFLWEQPGSPLLIRAEQTGAGNLSVKLVVYGYSAFTAGRYPGAHGTITGSGLTTPTFGIAAS